MVVWKADQQYPMAVLHQKAGATVPAVAIERTPWGQHEQADSLRLVSCSDTGKVCEDGDSCACSRVGADACTLSACIWVQSAEHILVDRRNQTGMTPSTAGVCV